VTPVPGPDRSLAFAFVEDLDDPVLAPAERRHLERVRRLRRDEGLTVGDGAGRFRLVRFGPALEIDGPIVASPRPHPAVTVAFALTKGDRPELVVQKLTELGVDRVIPFVGERTVVRWDADKAGRNLERFRTVAREAAAQAHRPRLPEITPLTRFGEVLALPGLALAEPGGSPLAASVTAVAVGPEGGWTPEELRRVPVTVDLGPTVLRAETAALAAGTLLVAMRDGRVAPPA
jgi:16S rRNA (uracil1498-N3)-methyltransferase